MNQRDELAKQCANEIRVAWREVRSGLGQYASAIDRRAPSAGSGKCPADCTEVLAMLGLLPVSAVEQREAS